MVRRRRQDQTVNLFAFQDIITSVAGVMLFVLLLLVVQLTLKVAVAQPIEVAQVESDTEPQPPVSTTAQDVAEQSFQDLQRLQAELNHLQEINQKLRAASGQDIDQRISVAQQELDDLLDQAEQAKQKTRELESEVAATQISPERRELLKRRAAIESKLKGLDEEQERHAGGKLVTFKARSSGTGELWLVDVKASSASVFNIESPETAVGVRFPANLPPAAKTSLVVKELRKQTQKSQIVLLLRPSVSGTGIDILRAFRGAGYNVALELLDEDTMVSRPSASP